MTAPPPVVVSNAAEFSSRADDVFARIASRYDLLCDLFSLWIHRYWKRRVAEVIAAEPWQHLLDAATGTGDIILRVLQSQVLESSRHLIASDISPQMLAIARRRLSRVSNVIDFRVLDATAMLGISDSSVDLYSMSLGLKICDRTMVLREAIRILKPGGRLVLLEASNIKWHWLHQIYLAYMSICMPVIGFIATGGDASAYRYLLQGVREIPSAEELALELQKIGLSEVSFQRLSLGIVAIHVARKPHVSGSSETEYK